MIIIAGNSHQSLAKKIAKNMGCNIIYAHTEKFPNQELKVQIKENLFNENVVIVQSMNSPTNDYLMELLLLANAAKNAQCKRITALIPYFGYSRQDKLFYKNEPSSTLLVAKIIEVSGIDEVLTIDAHSSNIKNYFKIKFNNINPTDLFVSKLKKNKNYVIISPDKGSISRAIILASKLKVSFASIYKKRHSTGECTILDCIGNIKEKDAIIIDDIADTGSTLSESSKFLIKNGVKSVSACITHAVFSKNCIQKISQINFNQFLTTNSIHHHILPSFVQTISLDALITKHQLIGDSL